jgi:hypothetical protein
VTDFERDFLSEPAITRFPGAHRPPPTPSAAPAPSAEPAPAAPSAFASDSPLAPEAFAPPPGLAGLLWRFADLARVAPTPFSLALVARAGGGKSSALGWVAAKLAGGPPLVRLEAADLAAEPERALAAGLYRALAPTHGALVEAAAREAEDFGADAGAVLHAAQERLDGLRRKLLAERQALADSQARRAALPDTLLYDSPGSEADSHARRARAGFEARMRGFGMSADSLLTFKDLTRDLAAREGVVSRLMSCARALHAYAGQTSLLVYAALFYLLGQGLGWLAQNKPVWLGWLSHANDAGAQTADYLRDRLGFLESGVTVATLLALACLGLNLWRAYGFCAPLLRGARLLDEEVAARAHELDHAVADHGRAVERLAAQVFDAAQQAQDAQTRAERAGAPRNPPAFLTREAEQHRRDQALGFLHALASALARKNARLAVAIDGFEKLGAGGGALFERLGVLLARPGFVALFALDPALVPAQAQARLLQLPLRLDAGPLDPPALAPLDAPLSPLEERLLEALAQGPANPRATRRLRNFYGFLRPAQGGDDPLAPALAFALAAELGGGAEREALEALVRGGHSDAARAPGFAELLRAAQEVGGPIEAEALRRAWALASTLAA